MLQVWITADIADKLNDYMAKNNISNLSEALEKIMSEIEVPVTATSEGFSESTKN
jgi:hypothetical protein